MHRSYVLLRSYKCILFRYLRSSMIKYQATVVGNLHASDIRHSQGGQGGYAQERNKVRWRPGKETSLAPPCSNIYGRSEANVLYWRKYLQHCWDFSGLPAVVWHPIVIRRPGNFMPPFPPSLRLWRVSYQFVIWKVVSKTTYFCSLKVERFGPPKNLGWLRHCFWPLSNGWLWPKPADFS